VQVHQKSKTKKKKLQKVGQYDYLKTALKSNRHGSPDYSKRDEDTGRHWYRKINDRRKESDKERQEVGLRRGG